MARVVASNVQALEAGRPERESYLPHLGITCLLGMGNGAAYIHRDDRREQMVPLPVIGHWMKQAGRLLQGLEEKTVPAPAGDVSPRPLDTLGAGPSITSSFLTLEIIPAVYASWRLWQPKRGHLASQVPVGHELQR